MGRRDVAGFSFIEVLAALGLLAILLVVAVPQLTAPGTLSVAVVADQLAADLRLARQLAVARRANYVLEFSPLTPPYTSYAVRAVAAGTPEPDFPKEIVAGVTAAGRQRFIFIPTGCVDDDGAGGCAGSDGDVTLVADGDTARVRVYWYRGRVQVLQP